MKIATSEATLVVPTLTCSRVCAVAAPASVARASANANRRSAGVIGHPIVDSNGFSFGQDRSMSTIPPPPTHAKSPQQGGARGFAGAAGFAEDAAQGETMEPAPDLTTIPGRRIGGYR